MKAVGLDADWVLAQAETDWDGREIADAVDAGEGLKGRIALRHKAGGGTYQVEDAEAPYALIDYVHEAWQDATLEEVADELRRGGFRAHGAIHGVPGASAIGAAIWWERTPSPEGREGIVDDGIVVVDCALMMADGVSGSAPTPRERRADESVAEWVAAMPVGQQLRGVALAADCSDAELIEALGAGYQAPLVSAVWRGHRALCAINSDGTRAALRM